jgi:hypothetical protein
MRKATLQANPFMLMMDPQTVFAAVERSERLARLQRRVCRPLDKIPVAMAQDPALAGGAPISADQDDAED